MGPDIKNDVKTEIKLPELGENILAGDVIKVMVKVGDIIKANQPVIEIETDKAAIEVPAPIAGKIESVHVKIGDKAKVGQKIFTVNSATNGQATTEKAPAKTTPTPAPAAKSAPADKAATPATTTTPSPVSTNTIGKLPSEIAAAPSVRRKAREMGVDLSRVSGSGFEGRISLADLEKGTSGTSGSATSLAALTLPDFSKWGATEKQPLSNVRRTTALHLSASWPTVPQVTHYDKADITDLETLRKQMSEKSGTKITVTAILLKICASALKKFPQFNASIDLKNDQMIYKKYVHIGVAADTERGLLVPVLRDVDRKNIVELSKELTVASEKARTRKLSIEEMQGANFTISNLGGIGGTNFSPIVNFPEAAILGVSRSSIEPVFMNGFFAPRQMLPLALSYDHRLIDGADAARFLRWIAEALQQPSLLAFEG